MAESNNEPRRESDILAEQAALRRGEWLRSHMTLIFAAVGVVLVAVIIIGILFYSRHTNPVSRMIQASAKDFNTSFNFKVTLSEGDTPRMSYTGAIDVNRSSHRINAVYDADYGDYSYAGAVYSENNKAVKGYYYNEKWTVEDCSDRMHDFFDFEVDFSRGEFDGGALLRFLGLSSEYSSEELNRFEAKLCQRLVSDGDLARLTTQQTDAGIEYTYDITLSEIFDDIIENGAPLFYHAPDYDAFKLRYEANRQEIEGARCTMRYTIDPQGYLSHFGLSVKTGGEIYALDCEMTDFGAAAVELPEAFLEEASHLEQ